MASGFKFDTSKFRNLDHLNDRLDRAIQGVCRFWDGPVETAMKVDAPWTDRTTNARNGLKAQHVALGKGKHAIICTHSVEYGVFLEVSNNAKYATIMPTIRKMAPKVMATLTKLLDRLDQTPGGAA